MINTPVKQVKWTVQMKEKFMSLVTLTHCKFFFIISIDQWNQKNGKEKLC